MLKKFILCSFISVLLVFIPFYCVLAEDTPVINSRFAIVIDRKTHSILYGKDEFNKVKMASTTKIMTATVVLEHCNLNETITVSKKASNTGGSRLGIKEGDKISVNDMLYGLMLCSGNDAAVALAEHVGGSIDGFANMMNQKAHELGLNNSHFVTPHGLDKDDHYTTAYELAILTDYALKNENFSKIVNTKSTTININGSPKNINNTNELLGNLDGVYGVKTGFTNGANRCLVAACKRGDLDVISVVLGADTKSFRGNDSIKIIEYAFNNFKYVNISDIANKEFDNWKKENLNSFNIYKPSKKNSSFDLNINDEKDVILPIKTSDIENLNVNINCEKNIVPPLKTGSILGKISVFSGTNELYFHDIMLSSDLYKKDFFEYFVDLLKKLKTT